MQGIGGQKVDMPSLCSAELWKASERWDLMGKELLRLKDRHDHDYCLAPTHEEAVTSLVAQQKSFSYRHLPLLLYQVPYVLGYILYLVLVKASYSITFFFPKKNRSRANSETNQRQGLVCSVGRSST